MANLERLTAANVFTADTLRAMETDLREAQLNADQFTEDGADILDEISSAIDSIEEAFTHDCDDKCASSGCHQTAKDRARIMSPQKTHELSNQRV